ncbi:MAG: CpaF family protein [Ardenticatenaceae bacterium]|nr:CpaF family protein [Ardenticatenaceae bacterium]
MTEYDRERAKTVLWLAQKIESSLPEDTVMDRDNAKTLERILRRFERAKQHDSIKIRADEEEEIFDMILDEIFGFGPLQKILDDESVTEVMVNRADLTYVERKGKLGVADEIQFVNDGHVERVINKIIKPLGRYVDAKSPLVDARLPDGSRVNAMIGPVAIDGPNITIRKFSKNPFGIKDLINFGSMTDDMALFLEACVVAKLNVIVAGGTGSGKTTLLNVLSSFIPADERIITIEDAAELSLLQEHVVRLETKKAIGPNSTEVSIRDLVRNALRMRPERIVVGECRGGEALDMLQAMNTGQDGSLTTIHANTPRDTISRLTTLVLMSGMSLPILVVLKQIASAVDLIVQQARLRDGSRKIINITEVADLEGDMITLQDVFSFVEKPGEDGKVAGGFEPSGRRPLCEERLKSYGVTFPAKMFMPPSRL